jgi:hypothetical protein
MDGAAHDHCSTGTVLAAMALIMATATGPPRASERVYGVEEVVATLDAEIGLQGRTEATARLAALARPVHGECAHWQVLGVPGRVEFGQCRASFEPGRVPACVVVCRLPI